jgi:hypothetical protein
LSKINFEIESAEIISENSDSQFATARMLLFSSGPNRHDLICSEEVLRKTAPSAYEKPIIFEIGFGGDFGTHSKKTIPAGFIVKDSAEFERLPDGRLSLFVIGKVWKMYSGKFLDIFKSKGKNTSKLSVEMELFDSEKRPDLLTEMKSFAYSAACILGDMVTEASPSANIQILSFSEEDEIKYNDDLMKEFFKYDGIDMRIPDSVKKQCAKALDLYKKYGGATSVSLSFARFMVKNSIITPEKVRSIYKYLDSHKNGLENDGIPDGKYISCLCYGGNEGLSWSKELIEKINELDNKKKAYFSDINPKKEETIVEDEKEEVKMEAEVEMAAETPEEEEKEDSAEEKAETKEEEKEEHEEEKMSLDSYLDVPAMLAILDEETEGYQELVDAHKGGVEINYAKLAYAMYTKCCKMGEMMTKMAADTDVYMQENMSLKAFKKDVEDRQFMFEVEQTMAEVSETMPKKEFEDAREDAKNFSIETVDAWKNKVKAIAFSFAKEHKTKPAGFALPFSGEQKKEGKTLWG